MACLRLLEERPHDGHHSTSQGRSTALGRAAACMLTATAVPVDNSRRRAIGAVAGQPDGNTGGIMRKQPAFLVICRARIVQPIFGGVSSYATRSDESSESTTPTRVMILVIDAFRPDYIERFAM